MKIQAPYLLFLGDANDELSIKMAKGVADWRPEQCVGEYRLDNCTVSTGQPAMDIKAAKAAGAKTFVLSFANSGGTIDPAWIPLSSRYSKMICMLSAAFIRNSLILSKLVN